MDLSKYNLDKLLQLNIKGIHTSITSKEIEKYGQYHMITAFNFMEHVFDINLAMFNLKKCLFLDGLLFIVVPDASRYNKHKHPIKYFTQEHINHFDRYSLLNLGKKHGFCAVDIIQSYVNDGKINNKWPTVGILFKLYKNREKIEIQPNTNCVKRMKKYIKNLNNLDHSVKTLIEKLYNNQNHIAIWGAGSGLTELMNSQLKACNIDFIVDRDASKQNRLIAGHTIRSPDVLKEYDGSIFIPPCYCLPGILKDIKNMGLKNKLYYIK
jgi:hypothetical protein